MPALAQPGDDASKHALCRNVTWRLRRHRAPTQPSRLLLLILPCPKRLQPWLLLGLSPVLARLLTRASQGEDQSLGSL